MAIRFKDSFRHTLYFRVFLLSICLFPIVFVWAFIAIDQAAPMLVLLINMTVFTILFLLMAVFDPPGVVLTHRKKKKETRDPEEQKTRLASSLHND